MVILIDAEEAFDRGSYSFMNNATKKLGTEGTS